MLYQRLDRANEKAQELSLANHSTFTTYATDEGFLVVNGVDQALARRRQAVYLNGRCQGYRDRFGCWQVFPA